MWWDWSGISTFTWGTELPCEQYFQSQEKVFTVQAVLFCVLVDYVLKVEVVIYEM